jgi:cytochrome c oxidase subunit IV
LCCFISSLFLIFLYLSAGLIVGIFLLVAVDSWDGISLTDFTYKDIPNIKKIMLFSWMTTNLYQVDFYELFSYKPGMS